MESNGERTDRNEEKTGWRRRLKGRLMGRVMGRGGLGGRRNRIFNTTPQQCKQGIVAMVKKRRGMW